jgi:hypothetical protein
MTQFTVVFAVSAVSFGRRERRKPMFPDRSSSNEFWCPLGESASSTAQKRVAALMSAVEWAALSRLAVGEWLSDQHIARLHELGLAEIVFGQALLTRLGRTTLGMPERE